MATHKTDCGKLLEAGISVVSINYRYLEHTKEGDTALVKTPLHDAARAPQFVRSKAKKWNIDKTRITATGESAGACSSLWLAFHDDLADTTSDDPVARESTRLFSVAAIAAQTTLDPKLIVEWMPNGFYGGHAYIDGKRFLARRNELLPLIKKHSPYNHISKDDRPVWMHYRRPPAIG
jgi:acetyl esterase/lipase